MNSPIGCLVLLLSCFVPAIVGYAAGAPESACSNMTPTHGVSPQALNTSPYNITLSAQSYSCNEAITVTLGGTTSFKGFFCQARSDVNIPTTTGSLTSMTQSPTTSNCNTNDAALTHADSSDKTSLQFKWTPAGNESAVIVCTFVQSKTMFWVQQSSGTITYSGCAATTPGNGGSSFYGSGRLPAQLLLLLFCSFVLLCY